MINPDRENKGLSKITPNPGDLRWCQVEIRNPTDPNPWQEKTLQRFEWSHTQNKFDWYDVPVTEEK